MINLINKLLFLLNLPLITYYSPYTKEERNKIYREALELIKNDTIPGLCLAISYSYPRKIYNLPELSISEPFVYWGFAYWWKPYEKEPRIKALEKAIKLTE